MPVKHLNIGTIKAIVINEGFSSIEPTFETISQRYPNATEAEFEDALARLGDDIPADEHHMNILYFEVGNERVLVDTGMGPQSPRPQLGKLLPTLAEEGITPEQITVVFLSHYHGDHINGLMNDGEPTFPNARYITPKAEWDHWMSPAQIEAFGERAAHYTAILDPLRDQFTFADAGDEILSGVTLVAMPGHTPGHSGLLIESEGERLLHMVDLLHHPTQMLYPDWQIKFDSDGDLAATTRREHLGRAADEVLRTLFYHLPFPALGKIVRDGDAFQWQPE